MVDNVVSDAGSELGRALRAAKAERNSRFSETAVLTRLVEEHRVLRERDLKTIKVLEAELRRFRGDKEGHFDPAIAGTSELGLEPQMVSALVGDELREQRARLSAVESDIRKLRTRYDKVFTSRSWRITAPLRKLRRALFG